MNPLISIIMPAYNAEDWIADAIINIINQTYSNWELIVINDGSIDNTEKICQRFANKEKRIQIYRQKNQGPSAARNYGLSKMNGDYFIIIDCDDFLRIDALQIYLDAALKYNAETVISGYIMKNLLSGQETKFCIEKETYFQVNHNINTKEIEKLLHIGLMASNWNKFYKNTISKIRFNEEISLNEDVLFALTALSKSKNVVVISDWLYEYRIQNTSSVSLKFHPEMPIALNALDHQLLQGQSNELRKGIRIWLMNYMYIYLQNICINKAVENNRLKLLKRAVHSDIFKKYGNLQTADSFGRKLGIILLKLRCYKLYINLIRLKKRI